MIVDNLVFEGGGALGVAYVGALDQLGDKINNVKRYAGSSVGAIVATALAAGADKAFIDDQLRSLDIAKLGAFSLLYAPWNLYKYYGLSDGNMLAEWFKKFLTTLTGNHEITFMELFKRTGKELIITGTSIRPINGKCAHYFDYQTQPNMPVITALRITTCVPGLFRPIKWVDEYWIDGGVLNNYPIEVFHLNGELMPNTIGLMLMTRKEDMLDIPPVKSFIDYVYCIMSCYYNQGQKTYIEAGDWEVTIKINCGKNTAMNFKNVNREALIAAGRDAVKKFIIKRQL